MARARSASRCPRRRPSRRSRSIAGWPRRRGACSRRASTSRRRGRGKWRTASPWRPTRSSPRTGARVAFVATEGFADLLTIGRQERPVLYALRPERAPSLVADGGRATAEAAERSGPDGRVLRALTAAALARARAPRARAAARGGGGRRCSTPTPRRAHERAVGRALARGAAGRAGRRCRTRWCAVTARSSAPRPRSSTRTSRRWCGATSGRSTRRARTALRVMQSNGGTAPRGAHRALSRCTPCSRARPAACSARARSARLARRPHAAHARHRRHLDRRRARRRRADDHARGGDRRARRSRSPCSTCTRSAPAAARSPASTPAARCVVGPRSAGADPGPACYGRGGPATVTDAQVVLGRIPPGHFLDGGDGARRRRRRGACWRRWAADWGCAARRAPRPCAAAQGVIAVADATIERALRLISVERGHDVRAGDAGRLRRRGAAPRLRAGRGPGRAPACSCRRDAGVLSAWGLLGADERHDASRTVLWRLARGAPWPRAAAARELRALAAQLLRAHGRDAAWRLTAQLRAALPRAVVRARRARGRGGLAAAARDPRAAFARLHERRFGYARPGEAIEVVDVRARRSRGPGRGCRRARVPRRTRRRDARLAPGAVAARGAGRATLASPGRPASWSTARRRGCRPAGAAGIDAHGNLLLERARGARR